MVPKALRTLSARVALGFAVLLVAFGVTMAWIVAYMDQVGVEISVIRTGYIGLALDTKELARTQQDLSNYVANDLAGEPDPRKVQARLRQYRAARENLLRHIEGILGDLGDVPARHEHRLAETRRRIEAMRAEIADARLLYEAITAAPPLEHQSQPAPDAVKLAAAIAALSRLKPAEQQLAGRAGDLAIYQEATVKNTAQVLELNETRLRLLTIALGGLALLVGLLITVWVTFNLRPLRRLRDAARRIAAGDYGSRIEEKGPTEVADLAREFNVMGRAVEERERELVRSERLVAVGKMAAMITHEVRNPLSSIGLNTELLEEELASLPVEDAAEARALCGAITREVDRLAAITEEYLAFARLPKPRLGPEQLDALVGDLATFVREDLAARGVELEVALAGGLPRVLIDEGQIRQSLLNLVRNAAEAVAGEGGGHVWLTTRHGAAPGFVEVEIRDDGPGIAADALPRVFDPFFSTKQGGTGLGLALTQQIVRDHGGDIQVASAAGRGASFVVSVPVARVAMEDDVDPSASATRVTSPLPDESSQGDEAEVVVPT